jgi:hypothetical protein
MTINDGVAQIRGANERYTGANERYTTFFVT